MCHCLVYCLKNLAVREALMKRFVSKRFVLNFPQPWGTPSLALKFCMIYCFQMQSGIWNNSFCFLAGNFFPTSCTLLGYFEVTWQLTMKLFPAKIFELATLQNLWRQRVTPLCYPRMLTNNRRYSEVLMNFQLYNKSLEDWSLRKQLILLPSNLNVSIGILGKQN